MTPPEYHRSIILPAYNEEDRLPATLQSVLDYAERSVKTVEVLVVNDGSTDGTVRVVERLMTMHPNLHLISYSPNRGKGAAVREGLLQARGACCLFMDADGATPVNHADACWELLEHGGADVVVGSRHIEGSVVQHAQSPLRKLAGDAYGFLTRVLVVRDVVDTQCGFKAFTREVSQTLGGNLKVDSAIFDIELLVLSVRSGFRVRQIPVTWTHDDDTRIKYNTARAVGTVLELFLLKFRYRILRPLRVKK